MKKQELKDMLNYHDDLYYNQDNPQISDEEYDTLKSQYISEFGEYDYVPGEASKNSKRFEHTSPILSLDKVQITDEDKLKAEIERLWPIVIQLKLDGLTVVSYPNPVESMGLTDFEHVTRGNGHTGEIITDNMKNVEGIGKSGVTVHVPVRSEALMKKTDFIKINQRRVAEGLEPFKNPRNAAAGMLRQKDPTKVEGISVLAYNMITNEIINPCPSTQLDILKDYGWDTVPSYSPESVEQAINFLRNTWENRDSIDYEIDGLVIKHDGIKDFGMTGHHPKNAIAVKFPSEGVWTKIKKITWQIGRTGKFTPVAEFEPIDLLGSEVSNATLHNFEYMQSLNLGYLASQGKYNIITEVYVIKANDIIPAITKVRHNTEGKSNIYSILQGPNSYCPVCKSKVVKVNDQHYCSNFECDARVLYRLVHMANKEAFDIEGLSEETAKKLIDKQKEIIEEVRTQMMNAEEVGECVDCNELSLHPSFIYNMTYEDILSLDGFAEKSAKKLYNAIQNSKIIDFDRFLYGCGIHLVGRRVSKDLAMHFSRIDGCSPSVMMGLEYDDKFELLHDIEGIGEETVNSLLESFETHVVPFGNYNMTYKPVKPKKKAEVQLTIVITGSFEIGRKEIESRIKDAGHKTSGSVSKKTSYLLASPGEESSSKYKKAKELNINIINTLSELEGILNV